MMQKGELLFQNIQEKEKKGVFGYESKRSKAACSK